MVPCIRRTLGRLDSTEIRRYLTEHGFAFPDQLSLAWDYPRPKYSAFGLERGILEICRRRKHYDYLSRFPGKLRLRFRYTGELTDQSVLNEGICAPFSLDTLPMLRYNLESYVHLRKNSIWRLPTYAISVASMYWARFTFLAQTPQQWGYCTHSVNVSYAVDSEKITSTRTTLNARWLLYIVLALQPLLTCIAFLLVTLCYSSPIDKGFGMIAVLSGVNKDSLDLVRGAALSGELSKPVKLGIEVGGVDDTSVNRGDVALRNHGSIGRIAYTLGQRSPKSRPLERGKKYM